MKEHPFSTFIDLVQFDQETQSFFEDLKILENEIIELEARKQYVMSAFEGAKQSVLSLKKQVDDSELSMRELDQLEAEKKKRLEGVVNQREHKSVQAELEAVNRKQRALEEKVVELWNKYEAAQKLVEVQKGESTQTITELDKAIDEKKAAMAEIGAKIERRENDRIALEKGLPEEWLDIYYTMRMRVANPVVPVINGSCSACFYPLPRQDLLMVQANRLVQCRSCYRLLYLEETQEKIEEQEKKKTEKSQQS